MTVMAAVSCGMLSMAQDQATVGDDLGWQVGKTNLAEKAASLQAQGSHRAAARTYAKMARLGTRNTSVAQALVGQADSLLAARSYHRAYSVYQRAADDYGRYLDVPRLCDGLGVLAEAYATGKASRVRLRHRSRAVTIYEQILKLSPAGPMAPTSLYRIGQLQEELDDYDLASRSYRQLLRDFPSAPIVPEARLALARVLLVLADQGDSNRRLVAEARWHLDRFGKEHPDHEGTATAAQLSLTADEYQAGYLAYLGEFYSRPAHFRPAAARRYLAQLLATYGDTPAATQATTQLAWLDSLPPPSTQTETAEEMLAGRKELPPPEYDARVWQELEDAELQRGDAIIQEQERVGKWLLPIGDLGLDGRSATRE